MTSSAPRRPVSQLIGAAALLLSSLAVGAEGSEAGDDVECKREGYPTAVVADYVLACMSANGNSFESLHQCSCSIDYISERISYEEYERVETVMEVQLDRGQRGIFYRDSKWANDRVDALQRVQAESTLQCF